MRVIVRDLRVSDGIRTYVCDSARTAVIAAYAQAECRDFNTADYERKYGDRVIEGNLTIACGDWCAMKDGK